VFPDSNGNVWSIHVRTGRSSLAPDGAEEALPLADGQRSFVKLAGATENFVSHLPSSARTAIRQTAFMEFFAVSARSAVLMISPFAHHRLRLGLVRTAELMRPFHPVSQGLNAAQAQGSK
jgi:hypothetical protein